MYALRVESTDPAFNLALEEVLFDSLSPENSGIFLIWRNSLPSLSAVTRTRLKKSTPPSAGNTALPWCAVLPGAEPYTMISAT